MMDALNRLAKWRAHFAGWQLGTRAKDDPESQAVRDHREATLVLRAEVSALTGLLIEKGVFNEAEMRLQVELEAGHLMKALEKRWPGVRATDAGLVLNPAEIEAAGWMKNWLP